MEFVCLLGGLAIVSAHFAIEAEYDPVQITAVGRGLYGLERISVYLYILRYQMPFLAEVATEAVVLLAHAGYFHVYFSDMAFKISKHTIHIVFAC